MKQVILLSLIRPMTEEYAEYLRDESRAAGRAESISFPKSEAEIIGILKSLHASRTPVTVQGARTGLAAAAVPGGGHVMSLRRMNSVTGCSADGEGRYSLTLQPGVILSQLRKGIEQKKFDTSGWSAESRAALEALRGAGGYFFPTDPTETSATLGGMTACNASGARSFLYGPMRRHVLALRVALADGQTLALRRGRVFAKKRSLQLKTEQGSLLDIPLPTYRMPHVKNASGYFAKDDMDAVDLFIGSDGTLGVITEIEIALSPLPPEIWGVTCFFESEDAALRYVRSMRHTVPQVAAVEYFDRDALNILRRQKAESPAFAGLPDLKDRFGTAVYAELHCSDEQTAAGRLFQLGQILEDCGGREADSWVARTQADLDRLHFFRHAAPESVNLLIDRRRKDEPAITKLGTDMSVPDGRLFTVFSMYRRGLRESGLESAVWGHIGDNHLHVNILPRDARDYHAGKELYRKWAAEVTRLGGAVSAEHGVGKLKSDFLKVMYGEAHIAEMAATKAVFDPCGLLGTGNLFQPRKGDK